MDPEQSPAQHTESAAPKVCPSCGFTGRQANEYRGGVLWRTCHDPWHHGQSGSSGPGGPE